MSIYSSTVLTLKPSLKDKERLEGRLLQQEKLLEEMKQEYDDLIEASKLITIVADKQALDTLDYITAVINKTLGELFKSDTRRIYLKKHLHAGRYAHLNVVLTDGDGKEYSITLQAGTGLRQVISFLFCLCLLQISGGRRLFIQDELLGGTHSAAKEVIKQIIRIFAKDFQFVMIEYGFDDIGKIYHVEKVGKEARVYPLSEESYDASSVYLFTEGIATVTNKVEN